MSPLSKRKSKSLGSLLVSFDVPALASASFASLAATAAWLVRSQAAKARFMVPFFVFRKGEKKRKRAPKGHQKGTKSFAFVRFWEKRKAKRQNLGVSMVSAKGFVTNSSLASREVTMLREAKMHEAFAGGVQRSGDIHLLETTSHGWHPLGFHLESHPNRPNHSHQLDLSEARAPLIVVLLVLHSWKRALNRRSWSNCTTLLGSQHD